MNRTMIRVLLALTLFTLPLAAATFPTGGPASTNNDDSCDISVLPAATLLLPYFEVNTDSQAGETTLFTIVNTTNVDQIARVTLWTDYSYPVITFNILLTGYDVQAINLFDVIERGIIAPEEGTGTAVHPRGPSSATNPALDLSRCDRLPGVLDDIYVQRMKDAFMEGRVAKLGNVIPACDPVGGVHENATGYVTIDVAGNCGFAQPNELDYFTKDIRYDNVLTGDYQQVNSTQNFAQGNALVHIRAIPEGGTATTRTTPEFQTNLPRTFYDRLSPVAFNDARQPLPSTFAARWISGGTGSFQTFYKVWRETALGPGAACADYALNAHMPFLDVVSFDESENAVSIATERATLEFPATGLLDVSDEMLPQMVNGAFAGWMYFNLDRAKNDRIATQGWMIVSMRAEGRYSTDFEALGLGNGCSAERGRSSATDTDGVTIGPAPNENE